MNMKLFDQVNLSTESSNAELSTEEILQHQIDRAGIEKDIKDDLELIASTEEIITSLSYAISIAEDKLSNEENSISKQDVENLNLVLAGTLNSVGISNEDIKLGTEDFADISDYNNELTLSIEASKGAITKILAGIRTIFARLSIKIDKLFNTDVVAANINSKILYKLKSDIEEIPDSFKTDTIKIDIYSTLEQTMGVTENKDPIKAINMCNDIFSQTDSVEKIINKITTMVDSDKKLSPIIKNDTILHKLKSKFFNKVKNLVCKSGDGDRIIVGVAAVDGIYVLSRCKMLGMGIGTRYSISTITNKILKTSGTLFNVGSELNNVPNKKDIIKAIDSASGIMDNLGKFHNKAYNVLDKGTKSLNDIDESMDFNNLSFYKVLPEIIYVLSRSYFTGTLATIELADGYRKKAKE